jgi:hypothetical protein
MTGGATIGQSGSNRQSAIYISIAVTDVRPLTFGSRKLALEELATSSNGSERITINDEARRVWCHGIAPTDTQLFCQGLTNALASHVRYLSLVDQLAEYGRRKKTASRKQHAKNLSP